VKPIAGTSSCEAAHLGYIVSGRMRVAMDDGTEGVFLDFTGFESYAKED
jgi:hypothetical protein